MLVMECVLTAIRKNMVITVSTVVVLIVKTEYAIETVHVFHV